MGGRARRAAPRAALFVWATLGAGGCGPVAAPASAVPRPELRAARHPRRVLLLPVQFTLVKDGGTYEPAETVEDSGRATVLAREALRETLARAGAEVTGELAWVGRIVFPDGRFGAPVTDEAGVLELSRALLAGDPPDAATLARLHAASGADALVLVAGAGTRLSNEKRAAQVLAVAAIAVAAATVTALVVALAVSSKGRGGSCLAGPGRITGGGGFVGYSKPVSRPASPVFLLGWRPPFHDEPPAHDLLDAGWYLPGHVHGAACAPRFGIHDGVLPVPPVGARRGFWKGPRLYLAIAALTLPGGTFELRRRTDLAADARRPASLRSALDALSRR